MKYCPLYFLIFAFLNNRGLGDDEVPVVQCPFAVTDGNGRHVPSQTASLKVGPSGPILLSDTNLLRSLAHNNRERLPERIVHAKGLGAHGYFKVTNDITKYTKAVVFSKINKTTQIFARFSAITGPQGYPDTVIDGRGISVKFYTEAGNWDFTGLSTTIFPIRDPMLFSSFVHAVKKNPRSNQVDPNDSWDARIKIPSAIFNALQTVAAIPDGYRHMNSYSQNAFKFVNASNNVTYVKFLLLSKQGVKNLTLADATRIAGENPDYFSTDMYNAIEAGNFPAWKLMIQIMTPQQASTYKYNPFDSTKEWLESDFPFMPVGDLVFNRNTVDHFSEVEMSAFDPGNLIPGIELSLDPLLHSRVFAYPDAQRYRLGANYQNFAINKPIVPVYSYDRDGSCAGANNAEITGYYPNSYDCATVDPSAAETPFVLSGTVSRTDTTNDDNYSQARLYLQRLGINDLNVIVENLATIFLLLKPQIQNGSLQLCANVNVTFANNIRARMNAKSGVVLPPPTG